MRTFRIGIGLFAAMMIMICGCSKTTQELDELESRDPLMKSAAARERAGDKDGAILLLRRVLDGKPDTALAHLKIALLYHDHESDYAGAIYHYKRYLELRPDTEKKDMIAGRIRDAEAWFCASLSDQPAPAHADLISLRKENERLKRDLRQVRMNLAEMSARLADVPSEPPHIPEKKTDTQVKRTRPLEEDAAGRFYVVQERDTLSRIAADVYEDPREWRRIYEANRDVIGDNPAVLKRGMKLVIPE